MPILSFADVEAPPGQKLHLSQNQRMFQDLARPLGFGSTHIGLNIVLYKAKLCVFSLSFAKRRQTAWRHRLSLLLCP